MSHRTSQSLLAVVGFGRSGTTWVADLLSKLSASLLLFEPFHPQQVAELLVGWGPLPEDLHEATAKHLSDLLGGSSRDPWLLRNHIPVGLDEVDPDFVDELWRHCQIGGFKSIRAAMMLPFLAEELGCRIVWVSRHPAAVVASILRRPNFWELGWPGTWDRFLERVLVEASAFEDLEDLRRLAASLDGEIERIAFMWALSERAARRDLATLDDAHLVVYEALYRDPFAVAGELAVDLGWSRNIHPSYLFTPAMTALKTVHGHAAKRDDLGLGPRAFWREILEPRQVDHILEVVSACGLVVEERADGGLDLR